MADFDAVGVLFLDPYLYLQLLLLHFADLPNSSCQNPFKYSKTVVAVVFWSTLQLGSDFGLQNMHSTPRFCLTRSLCVYVYFCYLRFAVCCQEVKILRFPHSLHQPLFRLPQCLPRPPPFCQSIFLGQTLFIIMLDSICSSARN